MKQLVQSYKTGEISLLEVPVCEPSAREVQIESLTSLISAGTERMLVSFGRGSLIDKAKSQPDKVRQVINKVKNEGLLDTYDAVSAKLDQPVPLGYSNVGMVTAIGSDITEFRVTDRVVSNGRHAEVINIGVNLVERVPDNVPSDLAIYSIVGSIGLQGIRLLKPEFGETVLVYGAGLIGLLAIQMLIRNGCRVLAVDIDIENLKVAAEYGAETIFASASNDFVSQVRALVSESVVDAALITASAKNDSIVKNCSEVLRKRGRIVLTGVVDLSFDRSWLYEKELSFQVSCSYGPGRYENSYEGLGLDYPIAFVRWTEKRNISAVLSAMSNGWIDTQYIEKASFHFDDAPAAYDLLTGKVAGRSTMAIELKYRGVKEASKTVCVASDAMSCAEPAISIIGAGNYATRRMLPAFQQRGTKIKHIVSKAGLSSSIAALRFGALYSSVDVNLLESDRDVRGVCIATRHDSHANLALKMIKAGKFVFLEKPIAINRTQLEAFRALSDVERGSLFVGFNREFSPYVEILKKQFDEDESNKIITLEMNAGYIPSDHWVQDPNLGGGRLIGEAIHYISLAQHISGSRIASLSIESLNSDVQVADSFSLSLVFEGGDLATILYHSVGSQKYKKEIVKCIGGGKILEIDNFKSLRGYGPGVNFKKTAFRQKKGQEECFNSFIDHVEANRKNDLEVVERYFNVTEAAILATETLLKGGRGSASLD